MELGIQVKSDDLSRIVDAASPCERTARRIERRVYAAAVEKTVGDVAGIGIIADDLALIVDAKCLGAGDPGPQGIVEGGVGAAAVEEAVDVVAGIGIIADDLARGVDAPCLGGAGLGRGIVEGGVGAVAVEETVDS